MIRLCFLTVCVSSLLCVAPATAATPEVAPLWPDGAPGAVGNEPLDQPSITIYRADGEQAGKAAVVICPGGGYQHLAFDYEGTDVAEWFNAQGVSACVLRYRLAPRYHHPAPLADAQRAIRTVRAHAADWKIDPAKIGILGFSAGGHLASTAATHFDQGHSDSQDPIEQLSCRPDFAVLVYPVVAMATEYGHAGSRKNLLGDQPDPKLLDSMSNERQVTSQTPPCFLVASNEDQAVPAENSVLFYLALRKANVPAELHVFERGPHGFGMGQKDPTLKTWPKLCSDWLRTHQFIGPADAK